MDWLKGRAAKNGVESTMPAELSFLESMYESQVLSTECLENSSFEIPDKDQTLLTELPALIQYYIPRWQQLGLLDKQQRQSSDNLAKPSDYFVSDPVKLIDLIHNGGLKHVESIGDIPVSAFWRNIEELLSKG